MAATSSFILGLGMTGLLFAYSHLVSSKHDCGRHPPLGAHMFLFFYGCISNIIPPVAIASLVAAGIADAQPGKTSMYSMRLGLAAYLVPWAFMAVPDLLWIGSGWDILVALLSVQVALLALITGITGFLGKHLATWERVLCVLLGIVEFYSRNFMEKNFELLVILGISLMLGLYLYRKHQQNDLLP